MTWKNFKGKKVFIRTIHGSIYSGLCKDVDDSNPNGLIFIDIIDKFGKEIIIVNSEIKKMEELRE